MAYTVRTTPEESDKVEKAKDCLGMASASKAMVEACYQLPILIATVKKQQDTISMLEYELNSLRRLLKSKLEADEALINAIKKR